MIKKVMAFLILRDLIRDQLDLSSNKEENIERAEHLGKLATHSVNATLKGLKQLPK